MAVAAVALVVGLALFEPWRLFTSSTLDEAAPVSAAQPTPTEETPGTPSDTASQSPEPEVQDRVLARGAFEDAEHATTGVVRLLELGDGRRFLRFEGLATSDGPDLHVWLTDQPSGGEWGSYDDGHVVRLGELKATRGNQNYEIPAAADLGPVVSAVIWCDRFNVAFGTAPLS